MLFKHNRTYASNFMRRSEAQPQFSANLPSAGRWRFEFHVPWTGNARYPLPYESLVGYRSYSMGPRDLAVHRFEINLGDTTELVELDLSEASTGWIQLGIFDTNAKKVSVTPCRSDRWCRDCRCSPMDSRVSHMYGVQLPRIGIIHSTPISDD